MTRRVSALLVLVLILTACKLPVFENVGGTTKTEIPTQASSTDTLIPFSTLPPVATTTSGAAENILPTRPSQHAPAATATPLPSPPGAPKSPQQGVLSRYLVQTGTPVQVQNFLHPDLACNWMGVGGQVFDAHGNPVTGLVVEVGGKLEGQEVLFLSLTGGAPDLGPGGYEITLADHTAASTGMLFLQLFDLDGKAQSPLYRFNTSDKCEQNMVLLNFVEILFTHNAYFPLIKNSSK